MALHAEIGPNSSKIEDLFGPQPRGAPGVGPFYYKRGRLYHTNNKKTHLYEKGPTFERKKALARNARLGAHMMDTPQPFPNHFPSIVYINQFILMDFPSISIYLFDFQLFFQYLYDL